MGVLSSASTRQQVIDEIRDTASYIEDNSAPKCRRHITALAIFIIDHARVATAAAGESMELDLAQARMMRDDAVQWLQSRPAADGGSSGVVHVDFRNFNV